MNEKLALDTVAAGKIKSDYEYLFISRKSMVILTKYLQDHDEDIANSMNDFGELREVYEELFGKLPTLLNHKAEELFSNEQSLEYHA